MSNDITRRVVSERVKVETWSIRGVDVDIYYQSGHFTADLGGKAYSETSVEEVVDRLRAATKRAQKKVNVPVTRLVPRSGMDPIVQDGTLTGIHQRNGNVLSSWEGVDRSGPKNEQLERDGSQEIYRRLSFDEKDRLISLRRALAEAEKAVNDFDDRFGIRPYEAVDALLNAESNG